MCVLICPASMLLHTDPVWQRQFAGSGGAGVRAMAEEIQAEEIQTPTDRGQG
jgi:hypothetical protein